MTDSEKALNLLIHDLRAPLSVAHGYLRLLQESRLPSEEDRRRALTQSIDALGRMTRALTEAEAFLGSDAAPDAAGASVPATELVRRIHTALPAMASTSFASPGRIRVASLDRTAEAILTIAAAVERERPSHPLGLRVVADDREMRLLFGQPDEVARLAEGTGGAFDPWHGGHGLALPLACRTIVRAAGRIWTLAGVRGAIGLALPLETSTA